MGGVLVVCAANQCRSPLAASVLTALLAEAGGDPTRRVESAGLYGPSGYPATALARQAAGEAGFDLAGHRSRTVDDVDPAAFDLVLAMEEVQRDALWAAFPALRPRVWRVGDLAGLPVDVEDPTGRGLAEHRATLRQLQRLLRLGLPKVTEILAGK